MTEQMASQLQLHTDIAEIIRVVDEIDNTVDAKDWTACRGYFLDEIYVDFTSLAGGSPGRIAAEQRQHDPRADHRPAVTGGEVGDAPEPTYMTGRRCRGVAIALTFHGDPSRTASWAPDGAAVRVFSRVTRAWRAKAAIEPARQCLRRCSS